MRIIFALLTLLFVNQGFAQQTYKVVRGERPPIDLDALPANAYHKGVLKIKLQESFTRQLDETPVKLANSTVVFGIPSIDNISREFGVNNFEKTFSSPAFKAEHAERHRAWGFHLWYYLYFDENVDVINLVRRYSALPEVMVAEPEYVKVPVYENKPGAAPENFSFKGTAWTPNDPRYGEQWHYHNTGQQNGTPDADIDLPEAWEITKGNAQVIVAIIDEGIQHTHPDITANMWSGIGYNFVNNNTNISPGDHGSHVAGTVAGVNNNAVGISGVAGGTGSGDGVRLMSCQVFSGWSSGGFQNAPIYAADNGAAISQNSWGYTSPNSYEQSVLDAIDYFNVNGGGEAMVDGGITIFAAGNSDSQGNYYPGYYSGTFSVAATNNQDKKSWYSNYGTWVDISAPGGETNQVTSRGVLSCWSNSNYGFYEGTSMACPHVSGIAALMVSLAYGQLTREQIIDIIQTTSDDHYGVNPGYIGKLGAGRANAHAALLETLNQMILVNDPLAFTALAASNEQINLNWVKNAENNDVMIAWNSSDAFGDPIQEQSYNTGDEIEGGGTILYIGGANSFQHTGLSSNTPYFYKAWSLNEVPEYSPGIAANATTLKDPIVSFPYLQSFDDDEFPPSSWENKKLAGAGAGLWNWQTTGADPVCEPQSGLGMTRFNSNDYAAGTSGLLVSPPVIFGSDNYEISFWLYRDNTETTVADKLEVYANLTPTTGFATLLGTIHRSTELAPVAEKEGWHLFTFVLPDNYKNKLTYIVLKGSSEQGNNLFVDEFMIQIPVSCFPPADLAVAEVTSSSAQVSWTAVEPATAWDVEYGPAGFDPGSGTLIPSVTSTFALLEGLNYDSSYDVYVRGACDEDNSSVWEGPVSFTTLCYTETPWDESFEAYNTGFECWQLKQNTDELGGLNGDVLNEPSGNTWFICTPETFQNNGSQYIFGGERSAVIETSATGYNWLITGEIQLPATGNHDLSFRLKYNHDDTHPTRFHVNMYVNNNWITLNSWITADNNNDYQVPVHMSLDEFNGQKVRLAFVYEGVNGHILAIDNISIMPATNYWTGNGSSNWNDAFNWRLSVPAANHSAEILPGLNNPEIGGTFAIQGLSIHPGAAITLLPDAKVTINESITNNAGSAGLILKANSSSQAQLILNQESVAATLEFASQTAANLLQSSLWSVPVSGQAVEPVIGSNDQLLKWDAPTSAWISARLQGGAWNPEFDNEFISGQGYLANFVSSGIHSISGTLTGSAVTPALAASGAWHLLGNPYTSSITWNGTNTTLAGIVKIYDPLSGSFTDALEGTIIPAMGGFVVNALPAQTPAFTFNPADKSFAAPVIETVNLPKVEVVVTENTTNTTQKSLIVVQPEATETFDHNLDSRFLAAFAPSVYTLAGEDQLSLNALPQINTGKVIQLGFAKNTAADYNMSVSYDNLYSGIMVFLHDKKTGNIQDLGLQPSYNFTSEAGDAANRFELIFGTLGLDETDAASAISAFVAGGLLNIRSSAPLNGEFKLLQLNGTEVMRFKGNSSVSMQTAINTLSAGVYLLRYVENSTVKTIKVMVR